MNENWILFATLILFVFVFLFMAWYHRKFKVRQSFFYYLYRYLIEDYLLFIIRWLPGILGLGIRFLVYKLLFQRMGKNVTIQEGVYIAYPRGMSIGKNSAISYGCLIDATGKVKIGDWVRIGPRTYIASTNHIYSDKNKPIKLQGTVDKEVVIENDVWVGANVSILPGVKIGKGAVLGANTVVTKDILPYTVVVGNPARIIKNRE